jgi:predicted esterase
MEHSGTFGWLQSSDRPGTGSGTPSRLAARGGLLLIALTSSGLKTDVVFSEYSPLSTTTELVRRLYNPQSAVSIPRGQAIDLAKEHFALYVPDHPQALMVFIPPWPRAEVPRQWMAALNRHNMIMVTAANSGNEAPIVDRREPLALLAAHNVMTQFSVDPQQVYIGGFSGGARVALRLALGYPDVFRGALLNAGSDVIGTTDVPLPPADLLRQFQETSRVVFLTGERDEENVARDVHSRRSLEKWCVYDVLTLNEPRVGHELADVADFKRALDGLVAPRHVDPGKLENCREHLTPQRN